MRILNFPAFLLLVIIEIIFSYFLSKACSFLLGFFFWLLPLLLNDEDGRTFFFVLSFTGNHSITDTHCLFCTHPIFLQVQCCYFCCQLLWRLNPWPDMCSFKVKSACVASLGKDPDDKPFATRIPVSFFPIVLKQFVILFRLFALFTQKIVTLSRLTLIYQLYLSSLF